MNGSEGSYVRKRTFNACARCRKQKIRCSGTVPCEQCTRRAAHCVFDQKRPKILVSQRYLKELESRASGAQSNPQPPDTSEQEPDPSDDDDEDHDHHGMNGLSSHLASPVPSRTPAGFAQTAAPAAVNHEIQVEDPPGTEHETPHRDGVTSSEASLRNPVDSDVGNAFTVDDSNKSFYLGVSSNWAFGRRVLQMVHDQVNRDPISKACLLFEGSSYDLGWDGQRGPGKLDTSCIPAADFAIFLINAVKFHCGQLYHMFDEPTFMHQFDRFFANPSRQRDAPRLWYVHFLLILAFGKAFVVRNVKAGQPPGAELLVLAMQILPDITFLYSDPLQAMEVLSCAALYLQCLDKRSAAYNIIGQAVRMAVEQGMHTDMQNCLLSENDQKRSKKVWWTIYILDRQMTSLLGVPVGISDDDISQCSPSHVGCSRRSLALDLHVQLSKATAAILQTVYRKTKGKQGRFLSHIKEALDLVAKANDIRNENFPLDLNSDSTGLCRLSTHLHLLHHQCLILATRPLLYCFLQTRLKSKGPLKISSQHGARSLVRVCVGSAQQCLDILKALQSQSLLESFIPFDREATVSSAVVIAITNAIEPALVRNSDARQDLAYSILDEMAHSGNRTAEYQKRELQQLAADIKSHHTLYMSDQTIQQETPNSIRFPYLPTAADGMLRQCEEAQMNFDYMDALLNDWNSDDALNSEELHAVAASLDFLSAGDGLA